MSDLAPSFSWPAEGHAEPAATITGYLAHWARTTPDVVALRDGPTAFTYRELHRTVSVVAGILRERGVDIGDRVVLAGANTWQWVVAYLATLTAGAISVPTNTRLSPEQFAHQASLVDARLVLIDDAHAKIAELVTQPIANLDSDDSSIICSAGAAEELVEITSEMPAVISFTSGTTGVPKGALLSHEAIVRGSRVFARVMSTDSTDSTLVLVPLFHNTGFIDQLGQMMVVGGRTELLKWFKTETAILELSNNPVTFLTAVPSILRLLMTHPSADQAFSRARSVLYGGSPMPEPWSAEIAVRWPTLRLFHGYGLTEFTSAVSFLPPELSSGHLESVGIPAPDARLQIIDNDGTVVAEGGTGEIVVSGPTLMAGYWLAPELTAAKIQQGWLRTGDLGHISSGLLYLSGRVDDVINRGGEKVLPAALESVLCEIPAVAEACVFPLPDPVLQQRVHAVVRLREGSVEFPEADAFGLLRRVFPDYAIPETIFIWDDLPRGASGKVDRKQVVQRRIMEVE